MRFAFLAAFAVFSAVHLYASAKCNKMLRGVTKVFLISTLLGWYMTSVQEPAAVVIAAIATSWLGDVLLMCGMAGFVIGGGSFFISHLLYAAAYCLQTDMAAVPVWIMVLAPLVYLTAVVLVFRGLRGHIPSKLLYPGMAGYLATNGAMNCFALFQLIAMPCAASAMTFIGAVLFFASDSILFFVRFKKDCVFKTHFMVMLTYILAQFLIVEGFILMV